MGGKTLGRLIVHHVEFASEVNIKKIQIELVLRLVRAGAPVKLSDRIDITDPCDFDWKNDVEFTGEISAFEDPVNGRVIYKWGEENE